MMKASRIDVNKANKYGNTPFANACIEGKLDIIKYMMNDSRIDVNKENEDGITPFAWACSYNHFEIIKYMMNDSRIDVNKINTDEVTPFAIVCLQSIICSVSVQLLDCMQSNNWILKETIKYMMNDSRIDFNKKKYRWRNTFLLLYVKKVI